MATRPARPRHEQHRLSDLVDYLLQSVLSGTTSEQDDDDLRDSIERIGVESIIEILPQFDPLGKVSVAVKLIELEQKQPVEEMGSYAYHELRHRVGEVVGISGRHLSRLLQVISTPVEIQATVRQKQLSIVLAARVADLPADVQKKITERIASGECPRTVVQSYVGESNRKPASIATAFNRYVKSLRQMLESLEDDVDEIRFAPKGDELALLERAMSLHAQLIAALRKNEKSNDARGKQALEVLTKLAARRKRNG